MRKEYKEVFLAFGRDEKKKNLRLKYFEIHFVACFFLKWIIMTRPYELHANQIGFLTINLEKLNFSLMIMENS